MVEWEEAACDTLRRNFTQAGWKNGMLGYAAEARERKDYKTARTLERAARRKAPLCRGVSREPAIMCVDITKTKTSEILEAGGLRVGEADALTGGFPCQGFSSAGLRNPKDPRNRLYRECVRVIKEALPRTFCLENVRGLVSMEKGKVIRTICDQLANVGYDVSWKLIDCADYGVPQHRHRVIFLGKRIDVLVDRGPNGRPALYMGHGRGTIKHDDFFEKKFPESK